MISVSIVPVTKNYPHEWGIQCFSFNAHTNGWARFDGTFTPGERPMEEVCDEYVIVSPFVDELVEFARERGWHVINTQAKTFAT